MNSQLEAAVARTVELYAPDPELKDILRSVCHRWTFGYTDEEIEEAISRVDRKHFRQASKPGDAAARKKRKRARRAAGRR